VKKKIMMVVLRYEKRREENTYIIILRHTRMSMYLKCPCVCILNRDNIMVDNVDINTIKAQNGEKIR